MEKKDRKEKRIGMRNIGMPARVFRKLVNNWCLRRCRILYGLLRLAGVDGLRINIAMRCRENVSKDWGHAWLTRNGELVLERRGRMIDKPRTRMADDGKFVYWIYD